MDPSTANPACRIGQRAMGAAAVRYACRRACRSRLSRQRGGPAAGNGLHPIPQCTQHAAGDRSLSWRTAGLASARHATFHQGAAAGTARHPTAGRDHHVGGPDSKPAGAALCRAHTRDHQATDEPGEAVGWSGIIVHADFAASETFIARPETLCEFRSIRCNTSVTNGGAILVVVADDQLTKLVVAAEIDI